MRFLIALALLGVALAGYPSVTTRDDCPPAGYTAISGSWKLDNLPAYGKYAICLTPTEADGIGNDDVFNFTWNGVFKLTNSKLLVDRQIRIHAKYPSRVDFNDVTITEFSAEDSLGGSGEWYGLRLEGAPPDLPYPGHLKNKKFGNCGTLNDVTIDETRAREDDQSELHPLDVVNCSGYYTKFKDISILSNDYDENQDAVRITDSTQLVFEHLTVTISETGGDGDVADAVQVVRSEAAFIRPILFSADGDAFDVEDYSNITVCDGFLRSATGPGIADYDLGTVTEDDETAGSVIVAVAGRRNSVFPDDLIFQGTGGILYTLKSCPKKFSSHYDMKLWGEWYTTVPTDAN